MKKILFGIVPVVASVFLSGCVSHHQPVIVTDEPMTTTRTTRTVVVNEAPPPSRVEVEGVAPDAAHVWIGGYWMHSADHWVWIPGHWESRPRVNATWVPGHWDTERRGAGWVWTPGHWE